MLTKMYISSQWTKLTYKLKWFCTLHEFFSKAASFLHTEHHLKHYSQTTIVIDNNNRTTSYHILQTDYSDHFYRFQTITWIPSARIHSSAHSFCSFCIVNIIIIWNELVCMFITTTNCQSIILTHLYIHFGNNSNYIIEYLYLFFVIHVLPLMLYTT